MTIRERRSSTSDRRAIARGGRRTSDQPGRFPNVLVADSYDAARIPCVKYLDRLGFRVDEVISGTEMFDKIGRAQPHVILVENGLLPAPASHVVRQLTETANSLLIVMTSEVDALREWALLPHVAVLEKPFSLSMMVEEIRRLLRGQSLVPAQFPVSV